MISGSWHPQGSSARYEAELKLSDEHFYLQVQEEIERTSQQGDCSQLQISDRVGSIPRRITLPDGSLFQTTDNQTIDDWLKATRKAKHSTSSGLFHRLESNWHLILFSLVFVVAFTASLLKWGLPWASEKIAYSLPVAVAESVGKNTLETLDEVFLESSLLSEERQSQISQRFTEELAHIVDDEQGYELHFRRVAKMPEMANAFALPSGDLVVTDALVKQLSDEQLDSVILHEIGHVYYRHGMRRIIHDSSVTFILMAILGGDLSFAEELIIGLPVFLMHQHYSREAETEADQFAIEQMIKIGIDPEQFALALEIITKGDDGHDDHSYLSTHPATGERLKYARDRAGEFRAGN